MKINDIESMNLNKMKQLSVSDNACTYKLNNGSILKIFNPSIIQLAKFVDIDFERKILDAKPIKSSPEILVPTSAVYCKNNFVGYTMPRARGVDYNKVEDNLTFDQRVDLERYARIHSKLESVIKKNPDIVFPDFCTCDNIFIDKNENISFIDYDGLQVGKHKSISTSTSLGDPSSYYNDKHIDSLGYFTKELDKRSLIILYFLSAFNIDLNKVGTLFPNSNNKITLDLIFSVLNLDDPDFCHKVWKIFNNNEENEYLDDDVFRIAEKYGINIVAQNGNQFVKRLYKK